MPEVLTLPTPVKTSEPSAETPRKGKPMISAARIKRRVREAVLLHLDRLSPEWSIVINPRRKALDAPVAELHQEILRLFQRCSGS